MKTEILKKCNLCSSTSIAPVDRTNLMYQCARCGYVFDNPRPVFQEIENFYSKAGKYQFWLSEEQARDRLWEKRLKKVTNYKQSGRLLDVGTGIGQFLHFAKKYFWVFGTEVSQSAVALAKEKYGLEVMLGQMEFMDFGGAKFDCITLFHVLEHVPDPSLTIEKCKTLLASDGVIVVAVPNDLFSYEAIARRMLAFFKIGKWAKRGKFGLPRLDFDGGIDEIHLSHFTQPVLKKFFTNRGFLVMDSTLDPGYPVRSHRKIIDDFCYGFFWTIKKIFGLNFYNTMWLVVTLA